MMRWYDRYVLLLVLGIFWMNGVSSSGQVMYADFENHGVGIIYANSNWNWSVENHKVVVVTNIPYKGTKSLELLYTNTYFGEAHAIAHNFGHTNSASKSSVIRMSTMLYVDSEDTQFKWALGVRHTNDPNLIVWSDPTFGPVSTLHIGSTDTGYGLVTGRYARLTLYFDMEDNKASMDYDGEMVSTWKSCSNTLTNDFKTMHFIRKTNLAPGRVAFDNVILEDFPADTWAWWRFEEGTGMVTRDHLGHFPMQSISNRYGAHWLSTDNPWCYSGQGDLMDHYALNAYASEFVPALSNSPMTTNWTIEAVMRCYTGFWNSATIVRFTDRDTNGVRHGAAIDYTLSSGFWPMLDLRDVDALDSIYTDHYYSRKPFPADNEWHHIAGVKEGSNLSFYLDGLMVTNWVMSTNSDGGYLFTTNTWVYLGRALATNEMAYTNHALSELRFTCRALTPGEFIQPENADFLSIDDSSGTNLHVSILGNPPRIYQLDYSRDLSNGAIWYPVNSIWSTNTRTTIQMNIPSDTVRCYRIYRDIDQKHL